MAHARSFGHGVRVGNWQEDIASEEDRVQAFLAKQQAGQTLSQTVASVQATASTAQKLSRAGDGFLNNGETCQLSHPSSESVVSYLPSVLAAPGTPMACTAQPQAPPASRNAFTVVLCDAPTAERRITYGDNVYLQCRLPEHSVGYLCSEKLGLTGRPARYSGKQSVTFLQAESPTFDCAWTFVAVDPQMRFEMEGQPVPAGEPVLLKHARTGVLLAVFKQHVWRSEFGAEFEVACDTVLDRFHAESPENLFVIVEDTAPVSD
ncbi:uncharacterized protein MONBRDRAFT_34653 [Monosiga brevicollis MX1]|uniref:Uncharacterized protein n=1 Tax=Monosiga brevicollis TaxID=81824 RepID=A9VD38_MONBE|nr:uncharacterized protein MONBRDRAFT_34653 [Monosiga brevicollis MX1]EDQ84573.1 predicted protein [Monosiga brevicollis MX1]|eukprot:XP_001750600.1 hypothetical protein [Monosiga brevicollis MX1]